MMQVKGPVLAPIPVFIKTRFGQAGYEKWLNEISPQARTVYEHVLMPLNWYPMTAALTEPIIKLCELFYGGDYTGARELGRFVADFTMKGFKKYMAKIVSPAYLIKQTPKVIATNWQPTAVEVVELKAGHAMVRITRFPEMHAVIEWRHFGFAEQSLRIAGAKILEVNLTKSLVRGDPYTEFVFDWK